MAFPRIRNPLATAPHTKRLPDAEVRRRYPIYRWRVMESTFIGYAAFYLVRNNLGAISKDVGSALHYNDSMLGSILAITAATYGIGKFLMGAWSDRSDPRRFMALGLFLTAICNFAFGGVASFKLHLLLWGLNGLFQGMGWPPCGRSMGHWFSERERGWTFSIWNTSHNVGGGVAGLLAAWCVTHFGGWQYAFYLPGAIALVTSLYLVLRLVDTPQSVGLPPIEIYKNDMPSNHDEDNAERDLPFKTLFVEHVLNNKYIWLLASANFFAYVSRYSFLDWGAKYLREMKGATIMGGGWSVFIIEMSAIIPTILLGWMSDRIGGRRGMVAALCMIPIFLAFTIMLFTPKGMLWLDMVMLGVVGFCVYPVINLIVILALDLTSKKAIGTAAGFIGMLGYAGRVFESQGIGSILEYYKKLYGSRMAWDIIICSIMACTLIAGVLLAFTWKLRPRPAKPDAGVLVDEDALSGVSPQI